MTPCLYKWVMTVNFEVEQPGISLCLSFDQMSEASRAFKEAGRIPFFQYDTALKCQENEI